MPERPTLIIVSGLPGSGKTTLARKLAVERRAVRLCPDEWMSDLRVNLWDGEFRKRLERLQAGVAVDMLRAGGNVIIEWGTWARDERDTLRNLAREVGAQAELIVLDPPLDVLWHRVQERASEDPPMTHDHLAKAYGFFQRPDADESSAYDRCSHLRLHEAGPAEGAVAGAVPGGCRQDE